MNVRRLDDAAAGRLREAPRHRGIAVPSSRPHGKPGEVLAGRERRQLLRVGHREDLVARVVHADHRGDRDLRPGRVVADPKRGRDLGVGRGRGVDVANVPSGRSGRRAPSP